jgi:hypothetical protein
LKGNKKGKGNFVILNPAPRKITGGKNSTETIQTEKFET